MAYPRDIDLTPDEASEIGRVLHHHDTCKSLCDDFKYASGETCREYRERLKRIWGSPDGILKPEPYRGRT